MQSLSPYTNESQWHYRRASGTAVSIRRATLTDAATITDMGNRLIPAAHDGALPAVDMNLYLRQSFNLCQVRAELRQPTTRFFLAETEQGTAGMVKINQAMSPVAGLGRQPVELSRLYLNPGWIGKGVGSILMQYALSQAAKAKHDICWLMVWTGNRRALAFYQRWNFRIAQTLNHPVGQSTLPAHVMIRRIDS